MTHVKVCGIKEESHALLAAETGADERVSPAEFPKGFWKQVDYLLHHPRETVESIRSGVDLGRMGEADAEPERCTDGEMRVGPDAGSASGDVGDDPVGDR